MRAADLFTDRKQFKLFAASMSSHDMEGMRASLEELPSRATAQTIQDWILAKGEIFGYAMQQDPAAALEVLIRLHAAYPIEQSLRNTALASALGASHAGLAKWSVDLGVDPDAMCLPEGTTLLGILAYADIGSAPQVWREVFDRMLQASNRPQIVNPATMSDPVMLEKWLAIMPPPLDRAAWKALDPQAEIDEIIKDASYLASLPVLKKLIAVGFPCNPGAAVFMALIRGNVEAANLLFEHYPDTQVLSAYRTEDNETLLHAIGYREAANLLLDASEPVAAVTDFEQLLPFLMEIDESVCSRSQLTAHQVAPPSSLMLAWVRSSSEAMRLQGASPKPSRRATARRI